MNAISNADLINRLANKNRTYSVRKVFNRVVLMSLVVLLASSLAITAFFVSKSVQPQAENIQLLAMLVMIAGLLVALAGLLSVFILMWGAFVSTHIANLDLKNELFEAEAELIEAEADDPVLISMLECVEKGITDKNIDLNDIEDLAIATSRPVNRRLLSVFAVILKNPNEDIFSICRQQMFENKEMVPKGF